MNNLVFSYQDSKDIIKNKLNSTAENFVVIGYHLKQIKQNESYTEDGYKDICDFALKEYGISRSNTYHFMNINDRFSIGGNGTELLQEYKTFGSSKLAEMLTLDAEELKLISERTIRDEIREINKMKKEERESNTVSPARQTPETPDFTQSKRDFNILKIIIVDRLKNKEYATILNELICLSLSTMPELVKEKEARKIINPNMHFMHRKDKIVAFFEEDIIKCKELGKPTQEFTYIDLTKAITEIYNTDSSVPWKDFYGEEQPERQEEAKKETTNQEEQKEESFQTAETTTGQMEVNNYPQYMPGNVEKVKGEIVPIEETSQKEPIQNTQNIDFCECIFCNHKWDGDKATNYDTTASIIECPACHREMGVMQSVEYICFEIK